MAPGVKPLPEGGVLAEGSVTIRDLNRAMNWDLPDDEAVTVAGLLIHAALAHLAELAETWADETAGVRAIQRQLRDLGCEPNRALVRRRQADRART